MPRPVLGRKVRPFTVDAPSADSKTPSVAAAAKPAADPKLPKRPRYRIALAGGALVLVTAAGFIVKPGFIATSDSTAREALPGIVDGAPSVSLGSVKQKYRPEDALPDVGSLVWREPSAGAIQRQKDARKAIAAGNVAHETNANLETEQSPVVIRGRVVVPAGVEEGPTLGAPMTSEADTPTSRETAQQLLRDARQAMTEGRVEDAKKMALAADRLNVAFALFEDRPSAILSEIAKLETKSKSETTSKKTAVTEFQGGAALTDPISTDPLPTEPATNSPAEPFASAPAPEIAQTDPESELPAVKVNSSVPPSLPELERTPTQPEPEIVLSPAESLPLPSEPAAKLPIELTPQPVEPTPAQQVPVHSAPQVAQPAQQSHDIRILPGENRHPIPDNGMRLSFDFHGAPWEFVLTQFAAKLRMPLEMTLVPAGSLTYVDQQAYSPQETLNLMNVLLIEKGFTLQHRNGKLILRPQPSAISSRTDKPQPADETPLSEGAAGAKDRSAALLAAARRDIASGRLDDARRKADEAASLKAVFGLLEDRPEAVFEEIERVASQSQTMEQPQGVLPGTGAGDPWLSEKRMSINFRDAGWDLVMREFAQSAGLLLQMPETPPGTFSHVDTGLFSPAETLEVLNGFLSRVGYRSYRDGDALRVERLNPVFRGLR